MTEKGILLCSNFYELIGIAAEGVLWRCRPEEDGVLIHECNGCRALGSTMLYGENAWIEFDVRTGESRIVRRRTTAKDFAFMKLGKPNSIWMERTATR